MALADHAPSAKRKGPGCTAGKLAASLDDDDLAELRRWVTERHGWAAISASLNDALDVKLAAGTLSRHFGTPRLCSCDESR